MSSMANSASLSFLSVSRANRWSQLTVAPLTSYSGTSASPPNTLPSQWCTLVEEEEEEMAEVQGEARLTSGEDPI